VRLEKKSGEGPQAPKMSPRFLVRHAGQLSQFGVPYFVPTLVKNTQQLCLYGLRRSQANRMDCQDSARTKESRTQNSRAVMQEQAVAARNHRTASWA